MASKTAGKADAAETELKKAESEYAHLHPLASQGNEVSPITRGELRIILEDMLGNLASGTPISLKKDEKAIGDLIQAVGRLESRLQTVETAAPAPAAAPPAPAEADPQVAENKKAIGQLFAAMIGNERKVEGKIAENAKHLQGLLDSAGANERGLGEKIKENKKHIDGLIASVGEHERNLGLRIDGNEKLLAQVAHAGLELESHVNDLKKQLAELRTEVTGNTHEIGELLHVFKAVHDAAVVKEN